jgi:hypothetical protein
MKPYLKIIILFAGLYCTSCSKETLLTSGKLSSTQVQARLKQFPELLKLNQPTEGEIELVSSNGSYRHHDGLPSRESFWGIVYNDLTEKQGIDVGTFCVNTSCTDAVKNPLNPTSNSMHYEASYTEKQNDVFGKTVIYNLKSKDNLVTIAGEMYIPPRIFGAKPNTYGFSYMDRESGTITWNQDPNNEIGVGIHVLLESKDHRTTRGEVFLTDDDGVLNFSDFLQPSDSSFTSMRITLYRGNGTVKKGTDGRNYKLVVYSSCDETYYFAESSFK